jgi:hypothetical protein
MYKRLKGDHTAYLQAREAMGRLVSRPDATGLVEIFCPGNAPKHGMNPGRKDISISGFGTLPGARSESDRTWRKVVPISGPDG